MLLQAAKELNIDLNRSFMVGDKTEDMMAGKAAGIAHTVLVRTGKLVSDEGTALAEAVLDSVAQLPTYIKHQTR